jgi:aminopeptidase N
MRFLTGFFLLLVYYQMLGQSDPICELYLSEIEHWKSIQEEIELTNDPSIDITHYDLDLEVDIDSPWIEGTATVFATILEPDVSSIMLDFKSYYSILVIGGDAVGYSSEEDALTIDLDRQYQLGESIEVSITYSGIPQLENEIKGLRYETHNGNQPIIVTLSTPFLAHTWYPCKDGPSDKADSVFVSIAVKDTIIQGNAVRAVSNGTLAGVETLEQKKVYHWEHRYPIVPYYVMFAVSNFAEFTLDYSNETQNFPIVYSVFQESLDDIQFWQSDLPIVMDLFVDLFGDYPFADEKYGMTQLGFYGGIENQTNSIVGNMVGSGWFNVSVHELAHMWFADALTCSSWNHGWLNEGFATYSEALWAEETGGFENYLSTMLNKQYFGEGTVYLENTNDPFQVFVSIIYQKGAWVLHMLRGELGDEVFFEAIKAYFESYGTSYGHATTEDFQAVCELVSEKDLDPFFHQWIYEEYYPKYAYNFVQDDEDVYLTIHQEQEEQGWFTPFQMTIPVEISYEDGSREVVFLDNMLTFQSYVISTTQEVSGVALDPDHWILREVRLDTDLPVANLKQSLNSQYRIVQPVRDVIEIMGPSDLTLELEVYDLRGRMVMKVSGSILEISEIAPGIYHLVGTTKNGKVLSTKILKATP